MSGLFLISQKGASRGAKIALWVALGIEWAARGAWASEEVTAPPVLPESGSESSPAGGASHGAESTAAGSALEAPKPERPKLRELWAQERISAQWPGTFAGVRVLGGAGLNGLPLASRTPNAKGVFTDFHGSAELGLTAGVAGRHWGAAASVEYAPIVLVPSPYSVPASTLRFGFDMMWLPRGAWVRWAFEAGFSPWSVLRAVSEAGQGYVFQGVGYRVGARYRWLNFKRWDVEWYFGLRAERFTQVDTGFAGSAKQFPISVFSGGSGEATLTAGVVGVQFNFRKE